MMDISILIEILNSENIEGVATGLNYCKQKLTATNSGINLGSSYDIIEDMLSDVILEGSFSYDYCQHIKQLGSRVGNILKTKVLDSENESLWDSLNPILDDDDDLEIDIDDLQIIDRTERLTMGIVEALILKDLKDLGIGDLFYWIQYDERYAYISNALLHQKLEDYDTDYCYCRVIDSNQKQVKYLVGCVVASLPISELIAKV